MRLPAAFIASVILLSCGPRSGVHNDKQIKSSQEKPLYCGNAVAEDRNAEWVRTTLKIGGDFKKGERLFKQNCASCHAFDERVFGGPGIKGLFERLPEPKVQWLKNYILNSEKVFKSGDKYAVQLRKNYPDMQMNNFEASLSEEELNDLSFYVFSVGR